jgi:hypothetical protein
MIADQVFTLPHCTTTEHTSFRWHPTLRVVLLVLAIVGAIADVAGVMYLDSKQAVLKERVATLQDQATYHD